MSRCIFRKFDNPRAVAGMFYRNVDTYPAKLAANAHKLLKLHLRVASILLVRGCKMRKKGPRQLYWEACLSPIRF